MRSLLRERFVNAWCLAKEVERLGAAASEPRLAALCRTLRENYQYPVDTLVLSPTLERLAHRGVNEAITDGASGYARMLRGALGEPTAAKDDAPAVSSNVPTPGKRPVVLTPASPKGELLDVLAPAKFAGGMGGIFTIDTRAFPDGGTLTLTIRTGSAEASGSFELMTLRRHAGGMAAMPVARAHGVAPSTTRRLVHRFKRGERFWFGAWRADGTTGDGTNAFQVLVEATPRE